MKARFVKVTCLLCFVAGTLLYSTHMRAASIPLGCAMTPDKTVYKLGEMPRLQVALAVGYFSGRVEIRNALTGEDIWSVAAPRRRSTKGLGYFPVDPQGKPINLMWYGQPGMGKAYFPLCFLAEDRLAYSNGRGTVICDAKTGVVIYSLPRAYIYDMKAFTDGKTLVLTGVPGKDQVGTELWDATTGKLRYRLPGSGRALYLAVSPDQKYVAAKEGDGLLMELKLWNLP